MSPRSIGLIGGMSWICWPTIEADVELIAAQFLDPFGSVMAWLAQRLQFSKPKGLWVIAMWCDVVSHACRHNKALRLPADTAQWLELELVVAAFLPSDGGVPMVGTLAVH